MKLFWTKKVDWKSWKSGVSTGVGDRLRTAQDAGSIFAFSIDCIYTICILYILYMHNSYIVNIVYIVFIVCMGLRQKSLRAPGTKLATLAN